MVVGPVAVSVHAVAKACPPSLFVTVLTRVRCVNFSSLVIVHVLLSPAANVTLPLESQAPPKVTV